MTPGDNAALVRSIYEAFNRRDLDRLATLVTDDFMLVDIPTGMTFHGPSGFLQWLAGFTTALPDGHVEVTNLVATEEYVATEHTGRGTHQGPLQTPAGTIPPTGRAVAVPFAEVFQLRDGRVAGLRAYWDTATMLRQLGVLPEPTPVG